MISKSEAEALVGQYLRGKERPGLPFAIYEAKTIEKPYGWIFFYNSRKFIETQDMLSRLAGNGPIVVNKFTEKIIPLAANKPVEDSIAEYEGTIA